MRPDPPVAATLEEGFLRALRDDPDNEGHALVLADWLDEQGDPRGELLRVHLAIRKGPAAAERRVLEGRMITLLGQGVRPCVPVLVNSVGMRLAFIPAGNFLMGSPYGEAGLDPDELPLHAVTISRPFFLGVHPVTYREWHRVMDMPMSLPWDHWDCPVEGVSWDQAVQFCERLSGQRMERQARRRYRLPTEAEWEYACRANTQTAYHFGDILLPGHANFDARPAIGFFAEEHFRGQSTPVGSFPPNAFGLYDMHGNVWEWCADWYDTAYYQDSPPADPPGPAEGLGRVLRGGSWGDTEEHCRSAYRRNAGMPFSRHNDGRIGFRVVCTIGRPRRRRKEGQP